MAESFLILALAVLVLAAAYRILRGRSWDDPAGHVYRIGRKGDGLVVVSMILPDGHSGVGSSTGTATNEQGARLVGELTGALLAWGVAPEAILIGAFTGAERHGVDLEAVRITEERLKTLGTSGWDPLRNLGD